MPSGGFTPLIEEREGQFTIDSGQSQKYLSYIKTAAKTATSAAVNHALSMLGVPNPGIFASLYSAYSSKRHAERLTTLRGTNVYDCSCGFCDEAIDFAIGQKLGKAKSKVGSAALGFVPHADTLKSGVGKIRQKYRDSQGESPEAEWASVIWGNAKPANADIAADVDGEKLGLLAFGQDTGSCIKAFAIVAELMGDCRTSAPRR